MTKVGVRLAVGKRVEKRGKRICDRRTPPPQGAADRGPWCNVIIVPCGHRYGGGKRCPLRTVARTTTVLREVGFVSQSAGLRVVA
jgi:hypothetical protein